MYSVEQLPRCDLLRLSPRLGDSSCRLDETPDREKRGRRSEEEERGRRSTAEYGARIASSLVVLRRTLVPLLLSSSSFAYNESNTPLAYLCSAGESNTPRGDFGFSRATPAKATRRRRTCAPSAKATRRAGTLIPRVLRELKQHAAGALEIRRRKQHAARELCRYRVSATAWPHGWVL